MKGDLERVARECAEQWTSGRQHTEGYKIRLAEHIATALRRHGAAVLREAADHFKKAADEATSLIVNEGGELHWTEAEIAVIQEDVCEWLRARAEEANDAGRD